MEFYQVYKSGPRKGQCKTLRDRLIRYFMEGKGMYVESHSSKSTKLSKDGVDSIFIGSHGSCRRGKSKSASFDVADIQMGFMRAWESEKGLIA